MKKRMMMFQLMALMSAGPAPAADGVIRRLVWQVETSDPVERHWALTYGETVDFEVQYLDHRRPMDLTGGSVVLHARTNGMDTGLSYQATGSVMSAQGWATVRVAVDDLLPAGLTAASYRIAVTKGGSTNLLAAAGTFRLTGSGAGLAGAALPTPVAMEIRAEMAAATNQVMALLGPRITTLEAGTNEWSAAFAWGPHFAAGYLLPADITGLATTQQVAAAVSPLGPRIAALEGGTNAWQTAYGWGDHALAGYLLPADIAGLATTQQVAEAVAAIPVPDLSGLVPYTGATADLDLGDNDLIVGGHLEVDGRINLLGSGRYIDGLALISDWSSTRAASAISVSSRLGGYIPKASEIPGSASQAYWQLMDHDGMSGLAVGQVGEGEAVLFPRGVHFASDGAALWRGAEHYPVPDGPSSPLSTLADVALATNALVQSYLLGSNAWMIVSNDVLRIWQLSPTNSLQTNLLWQSGDAFPAAATQTLWTAILQLTQDLDAKGDRAWGNYAPDGSDNPDPAYMTFLNAPATVYASGAQWSTYGTYAVLTATGTVAFASGGDGQFRIGPNSTNWFGYIQGGSVTVGAVPDSLTVTGGGQTGGYAEIVYPYSGGDFPALWFTPSLALDFTEVGGAVWIDNLDGTATATAPAESAAGFWYATTTSVIDNYFTSTMPARLDGGIVGATNALPVVYDSVITISAGGKNYRIPAQEVLP